MSIGTLTILFDITMVYVASFVVLVMLSNMIVISNQLAVLCNMNVISKKPVVLPNMYVKGTRLCSACHG